VAEADLPALYAGAQLFVFPSLYEGFGLPVLEAMACGAPVVCSNTSSLPEVAGDAALLVDPLDVNALAAAIGRVLGDAALADDMRQRGLRQAARFTWAHTAQQTLAVYRSQTH
jgi:glycosyltransferase involved in cell wall biosynthesis